MPLQIVTPQANQQFWIDATPAMPTIACTARITGVQPDPTATASFTWSIDITDVVAVSTCASSRAGTCSQVVNAPNVVGGSWTPAFRGIQGGTAVITATVLQGGVQLQAQVQVQIRGRNPARATVTQQLGGAGTTADRIGCHESGRAQFDGAGMPLLGPGGDVGIMQLCNPAATCGQRWSWAANVAAGLALLAQKEAAARTHLNAHRVQGQYPNDQGLADAQVLQRETMQRYNGRPPYWAWNAATNRWEARPQTNYVALVLACQ